MNEAQKLGSQTAKGGFRNEDDVVEKFNNWETEEDAQQWLRTMGYDLLDIDFVNAEKLSGYKTDVQVQVKTKSASAIEFKNLQVKLVSNLKGFNQIDKRWVARYEGMWDIPSNIADVFKRFTGELPPTISSPKDKRRMFLNEFDEIEQNDFLSWLSTNKTLIVSDILKGRGKFSAEWMLVIQKVAKNSRWVLCPMSICMNHFGGGEISMSPRGSIKIGNITMQRKGGDGGRPSANMLQFKINPAELFDL